MKTLLSALILVASVLLHAPPASAQIMVYGSSLYQDGNLIKYSCGVISTDPEADFDEYPDGKAFECVVNDVFTVASGGCPNDPAFAQDFCSWEGTLTNAHAGDYAYKASALARVGIETMVLKDSEQSGVYCWADLACMQY